MNVPRRRGRLTPIQDAFDRGRDAQDFRASRARAHRRVDAGEAVAVCARCGTEVDVAVVMHDRARCEPGGARRVFTGSGWPTVGDVGVATVKQSREEHEASQAAGHPDDGLEPIAVS